MEKIICEKTKRVLKNKDRLEKSLGISIAVKGDDVIIDGPAEDEYIAGKVIEALDFGFPFSVALSIHDQDFMFEQINIKDYTKRKDLERVRARFIGKGGKTLRALSELTKCHFEIKGNFIGIIGDPEYMRNANEAVASLARGAKQANVYSFLEKHQVHPVLDLGLKPVKKRKR